MMCDGMCSDVVRVVCCLIRAYLFRCVLLRFVVGVCVLLCCACDFVFVMSGGIGLFHVLFCFGWCVVLCEWLLFLYDACARCVCVL